MQRQSVKAGEPPCARQSDQVGAATMLVYTLKVIAVQRKSLARVLR